MDEAAISQPQPRLQPVTTSPDQERVWWRFALAALAVAVVVTALLYLPTLSYYWVGEDFDWAVKKNWDRVVSFFNPAAGRRFYRPITWVTFVADYELWGVNPLGWRINNLLQSLLTGVLVWALARRLAGSVVAGLAALIFLLHPAHPGAVSWVTARPDVLCALFFVGSVLLFVAYLQRPRLLTYVLAWLVGLLAIMSKEMSVSLPAVLLLADLLFFAPAAWRAQGRGRFLRGRLALHLPFILLGGGYLLLRYWLAVSGISAFGTGLTTGLLSPANLTAYLAMILGLPGVEWLAGAWLWLLLGFGLLAVALARWGGRLAWFGLGWVAITLVPVANVGATDLNYRYVFLPSVGIALFAAAVLGRGVRELLERRGTAGWHGWLSAVATGLLLIAAAIGTVAHNEEWRVASTINYNYVSALKQAHPQVTAGSRFFITDLPFSYRRAYVFPAGVSNAVRMVYNDNSLQIYTPGVPANFEQLAQERGTASYYFQYTEGGMREYPDGASLLAARKVQPKD